MVFLDVGDDILNAGVLLGQLFRRVLVVFDGVVVELGLDLSGERTHCADGLCLVVQLDPIRPFERLT